MSTTGRARRETDDDGPADNDPDAGPVDQAPIDDGPDAGDASEHDHAACDGGAAHDVT